MAELHAYGGQVRTKGVFQYVAAEHLSLREPLSPGHRDVLLIANGLYRTLHQHVIGGRAQDHQDHQGQGHVPQDIHCLFQPRQAAGGNAADGKQPHLERKYHQKQNRHAVGWNGIQKEHNG